MKNSICQALNEKRWGESGEKHKKIPQNRTFCDLKQPDVGDE